MVRLHRQQNSREAAVMRTEAKVSQAAEFLRIMAIGNSDRATIAQFGLARDALLWVLGDDANRFAELMRRSLAAPLPAVGGDSVSALVNLGCSTRRMAEECVREALSELPHAGFEQLF